jgi:hypothetical protein
MPIVAICNLNKKDEKLYGYIFAYEAIIRAFLPPSAKVLAMVLIYQGALKGSGCRISIKELCTLTALDRTTVMRQLGFLVKAKIFTRHKTWRSWTYFFNKKAEEWKNEEM